VSERAVIDALPHAVIVTTPDGRIVLWNRPAERLYGWAEAEVVGRLVSEVLVSVSNHDEAAEIMESVVAGLPWEGDFTVLRADGDSVRAFVVDTPILDAHGTVLAIVGGSEDVTDQRLREQQLADLAEHLSLALESGGLGTWHTDLATGTTVFDAQLERLYGLAPGSFNGNFREYVSLIHPDDVARLFDTIHRALEQRSRFAVEYRVVWTDGSVHWLQGKGRLTFDESGAAIGTMGCVADVTDQKTVALERERTLDRLREAAENERVSAQRLAFLGEINDALAASTSRADVMRNVTRAAVPMLGDWCSIYVLDEGEIVPETELAHVDPSRAAYVKALQERFPYDPDATTGIPQVIRSGESQFYPQIDEEILAEAGASDEARAIVRSLGLRSAIAVPLAKGRRVFGALQLVNSETSRAYTLDDLALARAVANRIAATLENRRLAEQQRMIATTLQASLLPHTLPPVPGVDIAVRYWAAGEGTTVGGDFYDIFDVDDHWAVVIGDVCGTGPAAASLTALARHTIRAAAWNGAGPDDVLRQLNQAIRRSERDTFCTALYCTLAPAEHGMHLTVTAGGHPLPILQRADGSSELVGAAGTLLGAVDASRSVTTAADLGGGDTLVLYTDGVTDVPPPHDLSVADVRQMVARAAAATTTAEAMAVHLGNQIEKRRSFTERADDIALLVVRVVGA
jgi:PAS domain S-box-containing protein